MGMLERIKSTKGLHSDSVKCVVYAKSGAGKTSLLGTSDESKTLILSAESGLLSLADKDIASIAINRWVDLKVAYSEILKAIKDENFAYTTIGIDSLTEVADMLVKYLQASPEYSDPKNTFKMWGEYNARITELVKAFRDLPNVNVVFTALVDEVNDGGMLIKKPLIQGSKAQSMLGSFFDEVLYLSINESNGERQVHTQPTNYFEAKDRSGKLAEIEVPDLSVIFSKIKGV
jgi:hypothetical protein